MQRNRLLTTALTGLLASFILVGTTFAGPENKPAKAAWSPSRVVNAEVDDVAGTFVVDVSADKEVLGAELWVSGSLAGLLEWDVVSFDIPEGASVPITFTLLQTPDEVGHTIGGTVHLRANGKNLAKPLNLSLKKTAEEDPGEEDPGEEIEGDDGIVDEDGNLPISWSVGEGEDQTDVAEITPDLFDETGLAQILLIANRPLENVHLWLTPSLRDCVIAYLPVELIPSDVPDVLTVDDQGRIVFVAQDEQVPVILELVKPLGELGSCGGTLHLRSFAKSKRTWPAVLGFALGESDEEEEEAAPSAIVDAANFQLGPVSPGQIVSIFGTGIAPEELSVAALDEDGLIPENLSGVMVLADGYQMRLLAAGRGQINAIVPAKVKGNYADIVVINKGKSSAPMTVDLKKVVPRVFSAFGTGFGQAAAVNPSGVLNGGASPASVGSLLSLWVTGLADTSDPNFVPEAVAEEAVDLPFPIRVYIGSQQQILHYAGTAPGMLQAVTQINIEIAPDTPNGPQPVVIVVGAEQSPATTTITVE